MAGPRLLRVVDRSADLPNPRNVGAINADDAIETDVDNVGGVIEAVVFESVVVTRVVLGLAGQIFCHVLSR